MNDSLPKPPDALSKQMEQFSKISVPIVCGFQCSKLLFNTLKISTPPYQSKCSGIQHILIKFSETFCG